LEEGEEYILVVWLPERLYSGHCRPGWTGFLVGEKNVFYIYFWTTKKGTVKSLIKCKSASKTKKIYYNTIRLELITKFYRLNNSMLPEFFSLVASEIADNQEGQKGE